MQVTHQSQSQTQTQKQGYYLSMQHMQFMHLLHLSGHALDEYLQNQIEENPFLELSEKGPDEQEGIQEDGDADPDKEKSETYDEEFFEEEYQYDQARYYSQGQSDEELYQAPVMHLETFTEQLKTQVDLMDIPEDVKVLARYVIDELEEDGYLKRSNKDVAYDFSFSSGKFVDEEQVEKAVHVVQQCDPPGIGARSLQECLLLQLGRKKSPLPALENARKIVRDYYDKLTTRNFQPIITAMGISSDEFKDTLETIRGLNPTPNTTTDKYELLRNQIAPAFEVAYDGNEFSVAITNSRYGNLSIRQNLEDFSKSESLNNGRKGAKSEKKYWVNMANEAHCLIEAIRQREKTMMSVISSILKLQADFFKTGDKKLLKPMILEQVAGLSGCDISTVSRITSNKYVQTPYGCFLLKSLFSSSLKAGKENVSSHKVKELIEEIIRNENKQSPLTDNQIVQSLKEMGISIARRTVVKYRDMLGIPTYSLRHNII